jgi:Fur family zinc uptake transcriptional regulator
LVLELLVQAKEPIKAYDLLEIIQRKGGPRLTPSTIYRILEYLENQGLIHRVNSLAAYVACDQGLADCHSFLVVCPLCFKTTEINDAKLYHSIFDRLSDLGLAESLGGAEIRGVCPQCATNQATP